jgi:hypothetical protein
LFLPPGFSVWKKMPELELGRHLELARSSKFLNFASFTLPE